MALLRIIEDLSLDMPQLPIHYMLSQRKMPSFSGQETCKEAFNKLKQLLITAPVLSYPQFGTNSEFILETDASITGFRAVLGQKQEDGHAHKCTVYRPFCLLQQSWPCRWAMIIQEMNPQIEHRSGKSNVNADALSRNPIPEDSQSISESPNGTRNTTAEEEQSSEKHCNIGILQR